MYRTFHNYTNLLHNILTSIFSFNFLYKLLAIQSDEARHPHRCAPAELSELMTEDLSQVEGQK